MTRIEANSPPRIEALRWSTENTEDTEGEGCRANESSESKRISTALPHSFQFGQIRWPTPVRFRVLLCLLWTSEAPVPRSAIALSRVRVTENAPSGSTPDLYPMKTKGL